MAKKPRAEEIAEEELLRQQAEAERQQQEEAEKARKREELRALARQQELNEKGIMDVLVEHDEQPRALEGVAVGGLDANVWYLRYMVVERLGRQILLGGGYTQEELQEWLIPYALNDEKSYVRRAAVKHLTDIPALGKSSSMDGEPIVRKKAVEQLFKFLDKKEALEALGAVALHDPEPELRHTAVLKIVDQKVIAQVARNDVEPVIRQAATRKLTGQGDLAWIAINDPNLLVRSTAAELMTDVKALVKAASDSAVITQSPAPQDAEE
jgi:HEAT repeat protein